MTKEEFERFLDTVSAQLRGEAQTVGFESPRFFEQRVREVVQEKMDDPGITINLNPPAQAFPDIEIGIFGIEVKFSLKDEWRSVANSVLESNRIETVKHVYVLFGKMGGVPDVKWGDYESSVLHVRTSHVPRFEVQIDAPRSLFVQMGISYDEFRVLEMHDKMRYIRDYARGRMKSGERLWWLEDEPGEAHTLPLQARLYTTLDKAERDSLRAEAILLCPQVMKSSRAPRKYDDVALFMLTYHGVLCHQARDMFTAGSVTDQGTKGNGGLYMARSLALLEPELIDAAKRMDSALFEEYWGVSVAPEDRIKEWLRRADQCAGDVWCPSLVLFGGRYH